jgi:hypothetical protein
MTTNRIDLNAITNVESLFVNGTAGTGYVSLGLQSATPTITAGVGIYSDNSSRLSYKPSSGNVTTFDSTALSNNRIYGFPDADGTFTLLNTVQTLSNKTITDSSNDVAARKIVNTTGVVDFSASSAPAADQVLTAVSNTVGGWRDPAAKALYTTGDLVNVAGSAPPTIGQVLTAVDAENATWQSITPMSMWIITNSLATGLPDDTISIAGDWATRSINTLTSTPSASGLSIGGNTITISQAGIYHVDASAICFNVGFHKLRFRNFTAGVTSIVGTSEQACGFVNNTSRLTGLITVSGASNYQLQHWTDSENITQDTTYNKSMGQAAGASGENEVYTLITITKLPYY